MLRGRFHATTTKGLFDYAECCPDCRADWVVGRAGDRATIGCVFVSCSLTEGDFSVMVLFSRRYYDGFFFRGW